MTFPPDGQMPAVLFMHIEVVNIAVLPPANGGIWFNTGFKM